MAVPGVNDVGGRRQELRSPPQFRIMKVAHVRLYGPDASQGTPRSSTPNGGQRNRGIRRKSIGEKTAPRQGASSSSPSPLRVMATTGSRRRPRRTAGRPLTFAPGFMSGRCQVHPKTLASCGCQAGDPVLVLFLLECAAIRRPLSSAEEQINSAPAGADFGSGGNGRANQDDSVEGAQVMSDDGLQDRAARVGGEDGVRCLLCTLWPNSSLLDDETAVDGRVSVPLPMRDPGVSPCEGQAGPASDVPASPHAKRLGSLSNTGYEDEREYGAGEVISAFVRAARREQAAAVESESDDFAGAGVVGILPLGVDTIEINNACFCEPVPIAGRLGVLVRQPRTVSGSDPGSSAEGTTTVAPDLAVQGFASPLLRRATETAGSRRDAWLGKASAAGSVPPQELRPVPPATYTSLVKRSLNHVLVAEGCEIAVPALPEASLQTASTGGSDGGGNEVVHRHEGVAMAVIHELVGARSQQVWAGGSGLGVHSGVRHRAVTFASPERSPGMACTPRDAGGRQGYEALSAVLQGALCAIGPSSMLLVESGVEWQRTRAESDRVREGHGGRNGSDRDGAKTPAQAMQAGHPPAQQRGRGGADSPDGRVLPTAALAELMLLPMSAPRKRPDGLTPLEFLAPRGVLLTGPPGVGKTFAVRSAVDLVRSVTPTGGTPRPEVRLTTLNGAEILANGSWEACAALRNAFHAAEEWSKSTGRIDEEHGGFREPSITRRCAVIFLDEADGLLARRDRDGDKAGGGEGARPLAQLLTLMDGFSKAEGSHVIVIGATNRPGALDPALRRPGRFDRELALAPPDERQRASILGHHLAAVKVIGDETTIITVAQKCVGYVGADLAALAREAALLAARRHRVLQFQEAACTERAVGSQARPQELEGRATIALEDFVSAMKKVGASSLRGHQVIVPNTPWSDIGGMEEAKAKLRQAVEWPVVNKAAFDRMGLAPPRGILLYGPPGCSKTTLVRAAATAAGATFVCLSGADVFSPYLGEAEAAVRHAFLLARNAAPALLFFDEIEAIVTNRERDGQGSSNSAESRVLATFLTEMDGVGSSRGDGVIVIGATNRPEAVDKALLRPGRFDQLVYAPLPGEDARRQIFEVHTRKMAVDRENIDFRKLAKLSKGLTGAEIEGVCKEAAMSAIREKGFGDSGGPAVHARSATADSPATVSMAHLLDAVATSAERPGVSEDMVAQYERFASGR